jgi:hypothetical protein
MIVELALSIVTTKGNLVIWLPACEGQRNQLRRKRNLLCCRFANSQPKWALVDC